MDQEETKKTIKAIGWIVFIISIIFLLRQIVFIAGQFIYYDVYTSESISTIDIVYFSASIFVSIGIFIFGNKLRKDKLETPKSTEKIFIYTIILTIVAIIAEFLMFDDSLPIIPILLVPVLIKGLIDVKKLITKEK